MCGSAQCRCVECFCDEGEYDNCSVCKHEERRKAGMRYWWFCTGFFV